MSSQTCPWKSQWPLNDKCIQWSFLFLLLFSGRNIFLAPCPPTSFTAASFLGLCYGPDHVPEIHMLKSHPPSLSMRVHLETGPLKRRLGKMRLLGWPNSIVTCISLLFFFNSQHFIMFYRQCLFRFSHIPTLFPFSCFLQLYLRVISLS